MSCDFVASACEELSRGDSVMTKKTMNAVGILVTGTVMVKGQCATTIAGEKQRRRKTRWSGAHNNSIVQISLLQTICPCKRKAIETHCRQLYDFQDLDPSCTAFDQPVQS